MACETNSSSVWRVRLIPLAASKMALVSSCIKAAKQGEGHWQLNTRVAGGAMGEGTKCLCERGVSGRVKTWFVKDESQ